MSVLDELRALAPNRRLTISEAHNVAERQALALLKHHGIDGPAVPSTVITELPFMSVAVRTPMGSSGATKWIKPRWVVLLNGLEPTTRQRFSLGHEFKHVLDHAHAQTMYGAPTALSQRRVELLCDYFAGCLLMPRTWVKRAFGDGIQNVTDLAQLFQVSPAAMQVRLTQLGLVDPYARCGGIGNAYFRSRPASPLGQAA